MENRTVISYVLLKYDKRTDGIYTKATNDTIFEIPGFEIDPDENETSTFHSQSRLSTIGLLSTRISLSTLWMQKVRQLIPTYKEVRFGSLAKCQTFLMLAGAIKSPQICSCLLNLLKVQDSRDRQN